MDEDRRYTCDEFAEKVGISHGSVYTILTKHLKMRWVSARWVPHRLTQDLMTKRLDKAEILSKSYDDEGENFVNRIETINETLLRSYEPELKSQSSEWHTPDSPRPAKFCRK